MDKYFVKHYKLSSRTGFILITSEILANCPLSLIVCGADGKCYNQLAQSSNGTLNGGKHPVCIWKKKLKVDYGDLRKEFREFRIVKIRVCLFSFLDVINISTSCLHNVLFFGERVWCLACKREIGVVRNEAVYLIDVRECTLEPMCVATEFRMNEPDVRIARNRLVESEFLGRHSLAAIRIP